MKLSAVVLARALAFVETNDLDPRGSVFYPKFIPQIVERYQFQKYPRSFEELDETKGIEFLSGFAGRVAIQKFTIFSNILVLETRSNTTDSRTILEEMAEWGTATFGLRPLSESVRQWAYVSDVSFTTEFDILSTSPLERLAQKVGHAVSEIWKEPVRYHSLIAGVGHDPMARKNGIAGFTIARRAETPFSDNKYYSEAPLPTDLHIRLLEEYELDVRRSAGSS